MYDEATVITVTCSTMPTDDKTRRVKKQKSSPPSSGEVYKRCTELPEGIGPLPSKEQMAAKGLEAKVGMVTYGRESWALTNLGAWRNQSLQRTNKSNDFVKSKQREARRAMLLGDCVSHVSFSRAKNRSTVDTADSPSFRKDDEFTQLRVLPEESRGDVDSAKSSTIHVKDVTDVIVEDVDPR